MYKGNLPDQFFSQLIDVLNVIICFIFFQSNDQEKPNYFDRKVVIRQLRALQTLETVILMGCGLPHRMRFKAFNSRYRCIGPFKKFKRTDDNAIDDTKVLIRRDRFTSFY